MRDGVAAALIGTSALAVVLAGAVTVAGTPEALAVVAPADGLALPVSSVTAPPPAPEPPRIPDPDPDPELDGSPVEDEPMTEARRAFEARYPAQAAAVADPADPAGERWALLVGINEHVGAVADNTASREDAERLEALLLREGWDPDRVVTVTDTDATGEMLREGLAWLARSSGPDATVVFHYAGHSKKWYGDDGAIVDLALWPTDDDFVRRDELAALLGEVEHDALWGNVAACEAAGFDVGDLTGDGRVWTFSSRADEKSYEDPDHGHSVWGRFLLDRELWRADGPTPSVQDAFAAAGPDATAYTSLQEPFGPQTPVLVDDLGAPFTVTVPDGLAAAPPVPAGS